MKNLIRGSFLYIFCFIVIAIYTLAIYFIGHNFWPEKAKGSLILDKNNNIRGSYLIAQHVQGDRYFKARSTIKFNPQCDIAIYNESFKKDLIDRYDRSADHYDITMITTSASKHDPFITKREAMFQALSISKARSIDSKEIYKLIEQHTLPKQNLFFKLDIVNSSILNSILEDYLN